MNFRPFITCAVTGSGDTAGIHPDLPITPEQIASASIEAANAGAAVVHIHVREPDTGKPSRRLELYREVVERIRSTDVDVLINLTTGMGGDLRVGEGPEDTPLPESDIVGPEERIEHVRELLPDICTLDVGTMSFGGPNYIYLAPVSWVSQCARAIQELGVKPEIEVFDLGHIGIAEYLIREGLVEAPPFLQFCLGVAYGAPADTVSMETMASKLPADCVWSGFGTSRSQMPMAAQAILLGGNIRVGLEDNLYLSRGVFANNGELVERARGIAEGMGATIMTPSEVRELLGLPDRSR
jgi:3-dehydrocarnitine:acetyl-CoA trimethylamine transferase